MNHRIIARLAGAENDLRTARPGERGGHVADQPGAAAADCRDAGAVERHAVEQDLPLRLVQFGDVAGEAEPPEQSGREPTIDEIARALELAPEQITAAMDAITAPVSLYEPVYSEGGDALTVMDQVRDRKNTDEQWIESITLREAISHLSEREKRILALRFEAGRTQMEVAGQIGISQAQVSRLEKSAIRSIRKAILPS